MSLQRPKNERKTFVQILAYFVKMILKLSTRGLGMTFNLVSFRFQNDMQN